MRSLSQRISQIMVAKLVLVLVVQAALIGYFNRSIMMDLAQDKMETILATQAANATIPMWDYDTDSLESLVNTIIQEETVRGARVVEVNRNRETVLAEAGTGFEMPLTSLPLSKQIVFSQPGKEDRVLGRLDFIVDYTPIRQQISKIVAILLIITTFIFSLTSLFIAQWTKKSVEPIRTLSSLMSNDDILHRPLEELKNIKVNTQEVQQLITAFQSLQNQYLEYKNQLILSKEEAVKMQLAAEEASRAKSDFLANMSHELRTPLNSIIGLTQLMAQGERHAEKREMLHAVEFSSQNLLSIVNDILDLSKIESCNLILESIPFNPHTTIQSIVLMLKSMAQKKGLALLSELSMEEEVNFLGDPKRFSQIITNLVGNAIKYTDDGRVLVSATVNKTDNNRAILSVKVQDTGIGIPQDRLETIFEKFIQADETITRRFGGTGLGLSITKQLTEMMGGEITVESMLDIGSSFTVTIPFEITETKISAEVLQQQMTGQHGTIPVDQIRVCVAEDHPMNQMFVKKLLAHMGFKNFFVVENGALAVEAVEQDNVDMILMDCHMPVMSGYEATVAIRTMEKKTGTHVPIIAMTANALAGERDNCLRTGMDEYISKPVDRDKLVHILSKWVLFGTTGEIATTPEEKEEEDDLDILNLSNMRSFSDKNLSIEKEMANIFLSESDRQFEKLDSLCISGECIPWRETTHLMKGAAATIGAEHLRRLCEQAQKMINATASERHDILQDMKHAYEKVRDALKKHRLV